jgi:WD40 repeat protein
MHIWDAVAGFVEAEPLEHGVVELMETRDDWLNSLAVSVDGALIVSHSANDKVTRVWNMTTGERVRTIKRGVPALSKGKELLAAACLSARPVDTYIRADDDVIWLTAQDGGTANMLYQRLQQVDIGRMAELLVVGLNVGSPVSISPAGVNMSGVKTTCGPRARLA